MTIHTQNRRDIATVPEMRKESVKPMSRYIACDQLDKIGEVSTYYGFTPMKSPSISKADMEIAKDIIESDKQDADADLRSLPLHVEEKIALIRTYHEQNMHTLSQPVMLYFKDPFRGSIKKGSHHRYADLEILGTGSSIAEATLIQTARVMLKEESYENTRVEINSIGDRDSINHFSRELTSYYKKLINDMSPECRQLFKKDPFELLASKDESCKTLNEKAPRSMDFLSEESRRHLEEILEYMENLKIPYSINNSLLGNKKYCTETIFSIVNADDDSSSKSKEPQILAIGVRYNSLAKRFNMKRDVQGVGISLLISSNKSELRKPVTKLKRPVASFIQLGIESKLISLDVIEQLRQVKIPLYVSLARDRLGAQVSCVEKYHTPYVIVMGKKEAVERTAIVRNNDTHSQDVISLADLPKHMKKIEESYFKK